MFVAPVVIAATTLNLGNVLILAGIAFVSVSVIGIAHRPLPWPGQAFDLPQLYQAGIWTALVIGIGFTSVYAWRIASESARMSAGLAATQLALSREHRLAALGALATAAAHELGTPLGTIAVVARELERALPENSGEVEDVRLLRQQAERCRAIIARLANPEEALVGATARLPLGAFLDDIAAHHRGEDVAITVSVAVTKDSAVPQVWRAPELLHGLGNIIENAADFANATVAVSARWDEQFLDISVADDGPGFAPEIFEALGEPYITSRPGHHALVETDMGPQGPLDEHEGMGLGFFIAKILLEQTGGLVQAENPPGGGAMVSIRWARGVIDGPQPPAQTET
jgi:two-component system sensor histidine kinase RegB